MHVGRASRYQMHRVFALWGSVVVVHRVGCAYADGVATNPHLTQLTRFPVGTPLRLSEWIRWSLTHSGPGRKLHYAAVARGELRVSRPGSRWLYVTPEEYFRWLNRCRIETAEERQARLVRSADAIHREAQTL